MRYLFLLIGFVALSSNAQKQISGKVLDMMMLGELPYASIRIDSSQTVISLPDGTFTAKIDPTRKHHFRITYFGYQTLDTTISAEVIAKNSEFTFYVLSIAKELKTAIITSEFAKPRTTPIAYSNLNSRKMSEIQSSQDMVMALNTLPGVYATQQGGGSGDARISIRGFNQRNIAVMVDGIPVNDMENGQVYWSNFFGISNVTQMTQVQRGLGASKLANPSIGGSINMMSMDVGKEPQVQFTQEIGSANYYRTTLTASTGLYKNKIGFLGSVSIRKSDGWVDGLYDDMQSYFGKIDYRINEKNRIVIAGFAAPQSHGQRLFRAITSVYDTAFAQKYGLDTVYANQPRNMGARYNQHWGFYNPGTTIEKNGSKSDTTLGEQTLFAERQNEFNKPQFYIKYTKYISSKVTWNSTIYGSYGRGAGYRFSKTPQWDANYQYDFQRVYMLNAFGNAFVSPIDPNYSTTLKKNYEGYYLGSYNNHNWFGGLSTLSVQQKDYTFSAGIDIRSYKGEHYQKVEDLFGSDYVILAPSVAKNPRNTNPMFFVGDKFNYNYTGNINWKGWFMELEYQKDKLSAVLSTSGSVSSYQYIDHFNYDTTHFAKTGGYKDKVSDIYNFPIFNLKGGLSYNISKKVQLYGNVGRLERAPRYSNVFDFSGNLMLDPKNEITTATELGVKYKSQRLTVNLNIYNTDWKNRPLNSTPSYTDADGNRFSYNINGLKARHRGIEVEGIYVIDKKYLDFEIAAALGNWLWLSGANVTVLDIDGNAAIDGNGLPVNFNFSAKGVHVGDAPQNSLTAQLNIKPRKGFYIRPVFSAFGKHFADFEPASLQGEYQDRESFQLPSYYFINLHAGQYLQLKKVLKGKASLRIYGSIINLTNNLYITDGQHRLQNGFGSQSVANAFNPKNVEVFVSQLRTYTLGVKMEF